MSDKPASTTPVCRCARARARDLRRARSRGPMARRHRFLRVVVEPPRDASAWRHGDQCRDGAGQGRQGKAARSRRQDRGKAARRRSGRFRRGRRARLHQSHLEAAGLGGRAAHDAARGAAYGKSAIGRSAKVNVEYVSANPTGPMHVGHCRGAVFGDALCEPAAISPATTSRANITSTTPARRSTCSRARRSCATARRSARTSARSRKGFIPATISMPVGQALAAEHGDKLKAMPESAWLPIVRAKAIAMMMDDDQGRSRRAQHQARRVLLGALADRDRQQQGHRDHRFPARQGRRLRRPPAAAEGRSRSRITRTASRRCSAPPPMATTSTVR